MGIVVYGIIEAWLEREEFVPGSFTTERWEDFAEIQFNKNHSFVWALQESGLYTEERNWYSRAWREPGFKDKEISYQAREVVDADNAIDSTWVTAVEIEKALKLNDEGEKRGWKDTPKAALAFMRSFENRHEKVRLLVYRS